MLLLIIGEATQQGLPVDARFAQRMEQIKYAVLETDGSISVIPRAEHD